MTSPLDVLGSLASDHIVRKWVSDCEHRLAPQLSAYIATNPRPQGAKAIKDSIWGMIDVDAREVVVIDSPVLQRLRRIRQLGVSFLTYPTADYARFEHSLGAMHQAERMIRAISRRSDERLRVDIDSQLPIARLAALLHDCGHLPFSHLSERFYDHEECSNEALADEARALRSSIRKLVETKLPALAEALSLVVILTPSFRTVLQNCAGYSEDEVASAALAIVGRPPSARTAFLMQVITNAIDADKLDYMFRDSVATGVPIGIDLERLLFKLFCIEASDQMPEALKKIAVEGENAIVLATDLSGHQLAYDLAAARSILFERIYFHHKTRAAERVALRVLANLQPHPIELLIEDDNWFSPPLEEQYTKALRERRLPRRCFAMSRKFLMESAEIVSDRSQLPTELNDGWWRLSRDLATASTRSNFAESVVARVSEISLLLNGSSVECEVFTEPEPQPYDVSSAELLVRLPDGSVTTGESLAAQASAFTINPESTVWIYATESDDVRRFVFVAVEEVIHERYGLYFGRDAADLAKLDWSKINEIKRRLEAHDNSRYVARRQIRPLSLYARSAEAGDRIRRLIEKFGTFQLPSHHVVDYERIVRFIDQFPEVLVDPILTGLEKMLFIDPATLNDFRIHVRHTGAVPVPLTEQPGKSAGLLAYYLRGGTESFRPSELRASLEAGAEHLCLIDDFCLSGLQAETTLCQLFGEEGPLDEMLARELSPDLQEVLRSVDVKTRFVAATDDGLNQVRTRLGSLGLTIDVEAMVVASDHPLELSKLHIDRSGPLREWLEQVGTELLMSTKGVQNASKWTEELCRDRALGYGGLAMMVGSFYNIPTGAPVGLWSPGYAGGREWLPLLPRQEPSS